MKPGRRCNTSSGSASNGWCAARKSRISRSYTSMPKAACLETPVRATLSHFDAACRTTGLADPGPVARQTRSVVRGTLCTTRNANVLHQMLDVLGRRGGDFRDDPGDREIEQHPDRS